MSVVVGIDVGGTFTDVTAVDATGRAVVTKVPSRPRDEAAAVLAGLAALGIESRAVRRLVHGTTVGTNAVLERRGARVALVTTAGFRDLLEIGRTKRNIPALFVPTFVRPKPVVERAMRFEVAERMLHDGTVLTPLDVADLEATIQRVSATGAEAVAVCLLNAYANPQHEGLVADALKSRLPETPISLSAEVVPEYREFERFSTTALNAYLQPLMDRYLAQLDESLVASGFSHGILTIGSSGGVLTSATARRLPIRTIFSGPAGGVSQACFVARRAGLADFITYDMGGTSTDVCLVRELAPVTTTDNLIGAFPVKVPQIDIRTVGAGGGSVAWADIDGSLKVGPRSAGARPGPAAYGFGGIEPTVTDANVVLGRIGTTRSLGGSIRIDPALAAAAIDRFGATLGGLDRQEVAEGIVRIAVARMTSSIREISIQRGHDPRDFTLIAFGGAGPMHAIPIAEELGIPRVMVPRHPGNFSALGLLVSDLKHDDVRTHIGLLRDSAAAAARLFGEMEAVATAELEREGFGAEFRRLDRSLDLRYRGQAFELNVSIEPGPLDVSAVEAEFHRRHAATYGHANFHGIVELVNARLAAFGLVDKPEPPIYESASGSLADALVEHRDAWFNGAARRCPVYDRDRLPVAAVIPAPAMVEEFGATMVVFPGWRAELDPYGNVMLERAQVLSPPDDRGGSSEEETSATVANGAMRGRLGMGTRPPSERESPVDVITLEVVREALSSIVREMRVRLLRTAYSSILYEGEDFSCVLMDGDAQLLAMSRGQDHPIHIVPVAWSVKAVRERFGDDIRPGDIFLHNDPYTGGTHLNDIAMIYPIFVDDRLFLLPVVRAHWGDVGGMTPGSISGRATEIYQEGVRIPPIKVYDAGRPNQAALDLLFGNMRGPEDREGDFQAMIGTCRKAAERLEELIGRYGAATLRACIGEVLDRAEARMRQRMRELPRGEYRYEAYLEGGRVPFEPLRVHARLVIEDDAITVDLSGTSPQTAGGPTNVGPAMAPTGAFTILKAFLDPGGEVNSGAFRPLHVITPEGTVVNARRPAACGGMTEVKFCVESAVMGALSQALGGKVTGDIRGGGNHCYVGGPDRRGGETFIFYEYPAAGTGAFDGGDGSNAVRAFTEADTTTIQPVEAVEQKYPLRVERCALRQDSGGDGRWRGGLGLVREVRLLGDVAQLSVLAERSVLRPFGVCNGFSGAPNRFFVRRAGMTVEPSPLPGKVSGFPLAHDDVVVMESSGGGGYGDPFDRDLDLIAADLAQELITPRVAQDRYGVVLAGDRIDRAATMARRAERRAQRIRLTLVRDETLHEPSVRAIAVDTTTATRLALSVGNIVELINPHGAPVRAWVSAVEDREPNTARVSPETLAMLAMPADAGAEIRKVYPSSP